MHPVAPPITAAAQRGFDLAGQLFERRGVIDGAKGMPHLVVDGRRFSYYMPTHRGTVFVGAGNPRVSGPNGVLETVETTAHEVTHHMLRKKILAGPASWPLANQEQLEKGLAQTFAAAALVTGGDKTEQEWGWQLLDPATHTSPVKSHGKYVDAPLATHMSQVSNNFKKYLVKDMGAAHINAGVVQGAHLAIAKDIGMDEMSMLVTRAAVDSLKPVTSIRGWADKTLGAAQHLDEVASPPRFEAAVRDAWAGVGVTFDT